MPVDKGFWLLAKRELTVAAEDDLLGDKLPLLAPVIYLLYTNNYLVDRKTSEVKGSVHRLGMTRPMQKMSHLI
jgi:hypothetical protein